MIVSLSVLFGLNPGAVEPMKLVNTLTCPAVIAENCKFQVKSICVASVGNGGTELAISPCLTGSLKY